MKWLHCLRVSNPLTQETLFNRNLLSAQFWDKTRHKSVSSWNFWVKHQEAGIDKHMPSELRRGCFSYEDFCGWLSTRNKTLVDYCTYLELKAQVRLITDWKKPHSMPCVSGTYAMIIFNWSKMFGIRSSSLNLHHCQVVSLLMSFFSLCGSLTLFLILLSQNHKNNWNLHYTL